MQRISKFIILGVLLFPGAVMATNGDHLIGIGSKARGMGGAGIGLFHGAESALTNAALIGNVKESELFASVTACMPDVKTDMGSGYVSSDADFSPIPEVAYVERSSEHFSWGIGMFGTAGMGVDYRDAPVNMQMMTKLQLMQFALPLAYRSGGLSVGVTPIVQYGSLNIRYTGNTLPGASDDFGVGYHAGISYRYEGLTAGLVYKSAIDMKYEGQLSGAIRDFSGMAGFSDRLEQPYEAGAGVSYRYNAHTLALDYKLIGWRSAKGYNAFGWKDQNVYALGYEYARKSWAARIGYNHAKSPIRDQGSSGGLVNTMNLLGFPAIVERHYTAGFSKHWNAETTIDLALTYASEAKASYAGMFPGQNVSTKHRQRAVTLGIVKRF